jgi:DNA-binding NarL/FixJ family response regulator
MTLNRAANAVSPTDRARIAVALVDDDPNFLLFLESVFEASPRHRVAATAGSAEDAARWTEAMTPHVALLDIGLPGQAGSALVADLLQRFPRLIVIMLTAQAEDDAILDSIRAGAVGYLLKGVDQEEIVAAIDDALAGGAPMTPAIARRVLVALRQPTTPATVPVAAGKLATLTEREREVLELVAAGASNKEVSDRLAIALSTVKNNLLAIYTKLQVRSRTEAAMKFVGGNGSRA